MVSKYNVLTNKNEAKEATAVSINEEGEGTEAGSEEEARPLKATAIAVPFSGQERKRLWSICAGVIILLASFAVIIALLSRTHDKNEDRLQWFVKACNNDTIARHLKDLTAKPHVAGTPADMQTAEYVLDNFRNYGLSAHFKDFRALLSYPLSRNLTLFTKDSAHEFFQGTNATDGVIPPFHAYSPSGSVMAEVVYVNFGREEDYDYLQKMQVNVSGCIAIVRYGDTFRGDVARKAASKGAVGVLIYSDPQQFAPNGTEGSFPQSKWLPADGVQRGTVMDGIGDPSTAGYPSNENSERTSAKQSGRFPTIPSLPISGEDAWYILSSLSGPIAPSDWQGSLSLPHSYRLGRGRGILKLDYKENQTIVTIRNVFAVVTGSEEPDRYVILGNHRDAWTYGAVDPNSGTAVLLEIARILGILLEKGWRPRRSIILCSWDAEEFGMIGSTEWVEENVGILGAKAVSYLNVDCAVQGTGLFAGSSPQLDSLLVEVTKQVADPEAVHRTVHESWAARSNSTKVQISRLGGGGSDFAAFLQHAGVPSLDLYYGKDYPVYHSRYDTFKWMRKFGDPLFRRHVAVASIWGLLALRLADDRVLPFDYVTYADELQSYRERLGERIVGLENITLEPINSALRGFYEAASATAQEAEDLRKAAVRSSKMELRIRAFNDRLMQTERAFLDCDGLKGKSWFRHLIYAPSRGNEYKETSFPGIVDAIKAEEMQPPAVQHEIWRVARTISQATLALKGYLT